MKHKKWIALFMAICMLIVSIPVYAVDVPKVTASAVSGAPGDNVTVNLTLSDNPGFARLKVKIGYDEDLSIVGVSDKKVLALALTTSQTYEKNPYVLSWVDAANSDANGVIASITFHISETASVGEHTVSVTVAECYNAAYNTVSVTAVSGKVTVGSATCQHTDKTYHAAVNSTCQVHGNDAYYTCNSCNKIIAENGTTVLDAISLRTLGNHTFTAQVKNDSTQKTAATTTSEAVYYYSCSVCNICEHNDAHTFLGEKLVDENNLKIIAENKKANIGKTISLNVTLANNPGIWGMDVGVSYDDTVLELVEVKNGTVFNDTELTEVILTNNPVVLSYECSDFNDKTENGTIATLVFKIKDDAPLGKYDITLDCSDGDVINVDGEELPFALSHGSVEVTNILYGDVNNDGKVSKADSLLLKKYLAMWDVEIDEVAADVNGDGKISKADSLLLKKYLAMWDVTLGPSD